MENNNKTERQQEAETTRGAAQNEFGFKGADKSLCGTTDWYVVVTVRGTIKQMRERDIAADPKVVATLAGPYFTKSQAKDESGCYDPKWNLEQKAGQ